MFLLFCREFNIEAGLAINPTTSLQLIKDSLKSIDFVLLMAINPGITISERLIYGSESLRFESLREQNSTCLILKTTP